MKKMIFMVLASLVMMSCTKECESYENVYHYTHDEYATMYEFVEELYQTELFNMSEPVQPTYDEMMAISASVIRTAEFGDTVGEGDCEQVYRLMYRYFLVTQPQAEITQFLGYILEHGMY